MFNSLLGSCLFHLLKGHKLSNRDAGPKVEGNLGYNKLHTGFDVLVNSSGMITMVMRRLKRRICEPMIGQIIHECIPTYRDISDGLLEVLSNPLHHSLGPLWRGIENNDFVLKLNGHLLNTKIIIIVNNNPVNLREVRDWSLDLQVFDSGVFESSTKHIRVILGHKTCRDAWDLLGCRLGCKASILRDAIKELGWEARVENNLVDDKVLKNCIQALGGRVVNCLNCVCEFYTLQDLVTRKIQVLGRLPIDGVVFDCPYDIR